MDFLTHNLDVLDTKVTLGLLSQPHHNKSIIQNVCDTFGVFLLTMGQKCKWSKLLIWQKILGMYGFIFY